MGEVINLAAASDEAGVTLGLPSSAAPNFVDQDSSKIFSGRSFTRRDLSSRGK